MNRRALLFALLLTLAGPAIARVGSGQHYSHSSSSSGSRSSSSSGSRSSGSWSGGRSSSWSGSTGSGSSSGLPYSGPSADPWILFFVGHPLFTLALIGLVFVAWRSYARSFGATASTQRAFEEADGREVGPPSAREVTAWVDALRASDPDFDLVTFLDQVKALFLRVQGAWSEGDLAPVRRDLSDATFQRFRV